MVDELESYLDPMFGEHLVRTDRVKQSIVLSQEARIEQDLALFTQVATIPLPVPTFSIFMKFAWTKVDWRHRSCVFGIQMEA